MSIEVSGLGRRYGAFWAVRGVSFEVRSGVIMGLLGPNGAGKSTTMRMLSGYLPVSEGEARVNGVSVGELAAGWRRGLGYLPEQNPLYVDMYVREYLGYVGRLYGMRRVMPAVDRVVGLTGLGPMQGRRIRQLSKGYKQRVGLAAALINRPSTLILDEPTNGLDPNQIVEIRQVIRDVGRETAVLLSTHIMQEVEAMCSQVSIINRGALVASGPTSELLRLGGVARIHFRLKEEVSESELLVALGMERIERVSPFEWVALAGEGDTLREAIFRACVGHGWTLLELNSHGSQLEDVFRSLTASSSADNAPNR